MNSRDRSRGLPNQIEPIWRYEDARAFAADDATSVAPDGMRADRVLVSIGVRRPGPESRSPFGDASGIIALRAGERRPGAF